MNGDASIKLVSHALNQYKTWEQKIDKWQKTVLDAECVQANYNNYKCVMIATTIQLTIKTVN